MVNCYQAAFDDFVGHLMAIRAACLNHGAVGPGASEEVACKTDFVVYREMFIPFEVAVACAA